MSRKVERREFAERIEALCPGSRVVWGIGFHCGECCKKQSCPENNYCKTKTKAVQGFHKFLTVNKGSSLRKQFCKQIERHAASKGHRDVVMAAARRGSFFGAASSAAAAAKPILAFVYLVVAKEYFRAHDINIISYFDFH